MLRVRVGAMSGFLSVLCLCYRETFYGLNAHTYDCCKGKTLIWHLVRQTNLYRICLFGYDPTSVYNCVHV